MSGRFFGRGETPPAEPPVADAPPPEAAPPPAAVGPVPPPRTYSPQRERRSLAQLREVEMRDIGGLAVEMARRDDWRYPLLHSRCAEVLGIEERIHELDALIAAGDMAQRGVPVVECRCGAPIMRGQHFCAHCGRPAPETSPVVTCSHCGQPLPADVNFCSFCGNAVAGEEFADQPPPPPPIDETLVPPPSQEP
jgi:hypothetical protein